MNSGTRIPGRHHGTNPDYHIDVGSSGLVAYIKHGAPPNSFRFEMDEEQLVTHINACYEALTAIRQAKLLLGEVAS